MPVLPPNLIVSRSQTAFKWVGKKNIAWYCCSGSWQILEITMIEYRHSECRVQLRPNNFITYAMCATLVTRYLVLLHSWGKYSTKDRCWSWPMSDFGGGSPDIVICMLFGNWGLWPQENLNLISSEMIFLTDYVHVWCKVKLCAHKFNFVGWSPTLTMAGLPRVWLILMQTTHVMTV